jgi:hypothetical protein
MKTRGQRSEPQRSEREGQEAGFRIVSERVIIPLTRKKETTTEKAGSAGGARPDIMRRRGRAHADPADTDKEGRYE